MPRRYDPAKLRRAVSNYNSAVRRYNAGVQRQRTQMRRAIDSYNRDARADNARVAANQRALRAQIQRLSTARIVVRSATYYRSVTSLHETYETVERSAPGTWLEEREDILDLAQQETENSLALATVFDRDSEQDSPLQPADPEVEGYLRSFSDDLAARWQGALFALNPRNPDAARHFSSSSREILTRIIEEEARDDDVLSYDPSSALTGDGRPTRRARLAYCLVRAGKVSDSLAAFADADIANVIELFEVFNDGTHGQAGLYDLSHLGLIQGRVEGAIAFLHSALRS